MAKARAAAKKNEETKTEAVAEAPKPTKSSGPAPTVGRIVHLRICAAGAERANQMIATQAVCGNTVREGDVLPMIVTAVHGDTINGQALLDGDGTLWITSTPEGTAPGTWSWPPKV